MTNIEKAVTYFQALNQVSEDLMDELTDMTPEDLRTVAHLSGVRLATIETRMKVIRRAYDMLGNLRVKDSGQ